MGTAGGTATLKLDVSGMADGQATGLCHYGKRYAWLGVTQANGVNRITYSDNGTQTLGPTVNGPTVWIRSIIADAGTTWAFSFDEKEFTPFGKRYQFEWANYRGDRLGIFSYNNDTDAGFVDVDSFLYEFVGPKKK